MDTRNIKDPDSIIIDNRAGILDPDLEGTVLDIFRYYAHKLENDRKTNPEHSIRIDIGTGYFFFSGFGESCDIFKSIYDDKLLNGVKNPNWSTIAPIRVVIGKETDKQTKSILLSIVKDRLSLYDDKKIDFLRRLIEEGLMEFRVFEDRKFHVKIYNFYFTNPESYAEPIDIYAGSANFTASGLRSNIEICIPYRGSSTSRSLFRDWFTRLWERSNPDLDVLEVISNIKESDYVLLVPEVFFTKLINILNKRYLFPTRIGIEPDILLEFQNLSYFIVMERLQRYGGYLLANSVGLGKSYVACQVMKEYQLNFPDKKCLLIYPPRMKEEWGEYLNTFGIGDSVDTLSMGVMQKKPFDKKEEDFFFDYRIYTERYSLIVVDEVHNFRNPCNRSANLKEIIRSNPKADVLLLSATPISLGASDLINLIDLFYAGEKQRKFEVAGLKEIYDRTKKRVLKERTRGLDEELLKNLKEIETELSLKITWRIVQDFFKEDLRRLSGREVRYEEPIVREVRFDYPDVYKREIFDGIIRFLESLNYEPAKLWDGEGYKEDKHLLFWYKWQLYKRLESSLYAFYKSIDNLHKRFSLYKVSMEREKIVDSSDLAELSIGMNKKIFDKIIDKDRMGAVLFTYNGLDQPLKQEILGRLSDDIESTEAMLAKMKNIFGELDVDGNLVRYPIDGDEKIEELRDILKQNMERGKPTIVFSEYRDTIDYLYRSLNDDFPRIDFIHGGTKKSKDKLIDDFQRGLVDIILTTDVLSEGVNIPRADSVINFDLPYNPTILVQRAGRALRITNPKKLEIFNFRPEKEIDKELELYKRLGERLDLILKITGLDFVVWLIDEKKVKELHEDEKEEYLRYYDEYRDKIAVSNPDDLVRATIPAESKLDKTLRDAILRFMITPEDCDRIGGEVKKPICTMLKGNDDLFLVGEFGTRKITVNEVQDSLDRISGSITERDRHDINVLLKDTRDEIIREETSRGSINKTEQKLLKRINGVKERLSREENRKVLEKIKSQITSHALTPHEFVKVEEICRMIESLPPFMAGVDDSVETRDMWKDAVLLSSGEIKSRDIKLLAFIKYVEERT